MNDGKSAEDLVRRVEQLLAPTGFTVEPNTRVYQDGVQIGEFDVVLTGMVGSAPARYLFECRDRPSDGPQGTAWIEQLLGRRMAHKFDAVIGVSTTGFTEGARLLAKQHRIHLRVVRDAGEMIQGLEPIDYRLINPLIYPEGNVSIGIVPERVAVPDSYYTIDSSDFSLRRSGIGDFLRLHRFVAENLPRYIDRMAEGTQRFMFRYKGPLEIMQRGRVIRGNEISAYICFERSVTQGSLIALKNYEGESELLAQQIELVFKTRAGEFRAMFATTIKNDLVHFDLISTKLPPEIAEDVRKHGGGLFIVPRAGEKIVAKHFALKSD